MQAVRHSRLTVEVDVRSVAADEFSLLVPDLVELLADIVRGGATLGFLQPVVPDEARAYWTSLTSDIRAGTRVFIGAFSDGRIIGSGQLALSMFPNSKHRAELQKLFVVESARGQGVAHSLMAALHASARQRGRTLVLLNARRGSLAERFYRGLGYCDVGVVPGYNFGHDGQPYDSVSMYKQLEL
jgi:GNAT superfamily N-acetyltransferase